MNPSTPKPYPDWSDQPRDRLRDAAHTFGYHLMQYCRDPALDLLPPNMTSADRKKVVEAVHLALHNLMDLVEGYRKLRSGEEHSVEYNIQVRVKDLAGQTVETVDLAAGLDLPIGFWTWAREGKFR